MPVIKLAPYRSRETAKVLRALADMAEQGECIGVALCWQSPDHEEQIVFTGPYRENPATAVNAAMRLSWRLTRMQDEVRGSR